MHRKFYVRYCQEHKNKVPGNCSRVCSSERKYSKVHIVDFPCELAQEQKDQKHSGAERNFYVLMQRLKHRNRRNRR